MPGEEEKTVTIGGVDHSEEGPSGGNDDNDEEEDKPQTVGGYRPSAKSRMSVKELMQCDAGDESLKRYKAALLGLSGDEAENSAMLGDPNDPREVVILKFTVNLEDRPPLVFDLTSEEKINNLVNKPFTLKEGCNYSFLINFRVQHNIVSGLTWRNSVFKAGIKVVNQSETLGNYPPRVNEWQSDTYQCPSGFLARHSFKGRQKFIDIEGKLHLRFQYAFNIAKEWPATAEA